MITQVRAQMDGVQFDSLDSRLIIKEVSESTPSTAYTTQSTGTGRGLAITGYKRETLDVTIKFAIAEKRELQERTEIINKVCSWMGGKVLTVSYRSGVQLRVVPLTYPARGSARTWNQEYTLVLRAVECPYWQSASERSFTYQNVAYGDIQISNEGNEKAPLTAVISNTSVNTVNTVIIEYGGDMLRFDGLALANGERMLIGVTGGVMIAYIENEDGTRAVLGNRTVDSANMLYIRPGVSTLAFSSDYTLTWQFAVRALYL